MAEIMRWARILAGTEPEVTGATSLLHSPGIDRRTVVDLAFPGGATGRVTAEVDGKKRREKVTSDSSTHSYQLRAFVAAVRDGTPTLTPPEESVANMRVIDAA